MCLVGSSRDDRRVEQINFTAISGVEPEVTLTMAGNRRLLSTGLMRSGE